MMPLQTENTKTLAAFLQKLSLGQLAVQVLISVFLSSQLPKDFILVYGGQCDQKESLMIIYGKPYVNLREVTMYRRTSDVVKT